MPRWIASTVRASTFALSTLALVAGALVPWGAARAATGSELYITEYVEGSGANRAIELYNPTDLPVSLGGSGYMLAFFFNGDTTIDGGVALAGTVQPGHTWVVTPPDASAVLLAKANQVSVATSDWWFDGNDAVELLHNGLAIDVIGQVGFDPGAAGWGSGLTSTTDHTLRRKASVTAGDTNAGDPFDPSVEWTGYPIDTFDGLGMIGDPVTNAPVSVTCPAPLSTTQGVATSGSLSASDPDGVVGSLAVTAVAPSDPGTFSVTGVTPASGVGGTASGTLNVGAATPAGSYTVTVTATNGDATPQSDSCDVAVTVDAPPPPGPSLAGLHQLVDDLVASGAIRSERARLLDAALERAGDDLAAGRLSAFQAELRALGNQAEGLAPRWLTPAAADAIRDAALALATST